MADKDGRDLDDVGCYPVLGTVACRRDCRLWWACSPGRQTTWSLSNNP